MLLPDQIHINRIRERLWCGRDIGQASVMIGSGFSRNAVKVYPTAPPFPLWNDLVGELQTRLGSKNSDVIRLGSEYEVVFGRQSLDELLISLIPDLQYQPEKLHKLLLSLPWSDIFTTNYDTLLERTTPLVYDRKFDVVLTHSDLPGKMKPRIVKLHGSFPSHRPFIFTEEDYRTYPRKFSPFVNTVQQSIMENIFCLIGFSGDDPNFLNWIGWVRDNLGTSIPPIYLCGLLNLSTSQKQLLASKNIITVDISPIFPDSEYPDRNIQHARSIEWFLLNLMQGQPTNNIDWPDSPIAKDLQKWNPSVDLPDFLETTIPETTWNNLNPYSSYNQSINNFHSFDLEEINDLIKNWKVCRKKYPGFIVLPRTIRNHLWNFTDEWVSRLIRSQALQKMQESDEIDCLSALYEINWRLEKCLSPLYFEIQAGIESILVKINPFPKITDYDPKSSVITPKIKIKRDNKTKIDWNEVRNQWVSLAFAIIKEARRDRDQEKFNQWIINIKSIITLDPEWHSQWFHEQCLFELVELNKSNLSHLLDNWQLLTLSSIWLVRLSGILFEIGENKKSEEIAKRALNDIRARLRPYIIDYSLLSQEGIAMMILGIIEQSNNWEKAFDRSNEDRWDTLSNYKCNLMTELANLQKICEGELPQPKPFKEVREGFDPGYIFTSYHTGTKTTLSELRPGFELLIMMEEIGMSPVMQKSSTPKSVQWIEPYYPLWAIEILMRCQNETEIKEYFDSVSVETLEASNIKILHDWLISRLHNSIERMKSNRYSANYRDDAWVSFNISLEILSRILSRISDEKSIQLFNTIILYLSDSQDRQSVQISSTIESFWRRAFERNSNIDTLHSVKSLLKIVLPNAQSYIANSIEPFVHIQWKNNFLLPEEFDRSGWSIDISKLIVNVHHGDNIAREYSLLRLLKLIEINALSILEQKSLASALWSKLDPLTGLPSHCLQKSILLRFPEPEENKGTVINLLKQYIISCEIEDALDLFLNSSLPQLLRPVCILQNRIIWSPDELHIILDKIHQYIANTIGNSANEIANLPDSISSPMII